MNKFEIEVKYPELIDKLEQIGCAVTTKESNKTLEISDYETIITAIISFASGVSASLVANCIWKFILNKKNDSKTHIRINKTDIKSYSRTEIIKIIKKSK